ncbi:hypothetical protein [Bacillus altitudinis]|uniref:hypothetical protein n=1 Tax=Bacillus altitudinis TaxID=293387 RepID=UPI0011A15D5E|nr:hypothetical protein [Bacillus altitudinis]
MGGRDWCDNSLDEVVEKVGVECLVVVGDKVGVDWVFAWGWYVELAGDPLGFVLDRGVVLVLGFLLACDDGF